MRETDFIKQNKEKWLELEQILKEKTKDPDRLSDLFIQVTDDLSYSKTFFKNRTIRVYLNNIAQQVFQNIYKNKKSRWSEVTAFWKEELPQIVYESRKELLFSLLTFIVAVIIGIVSYANEPEFAHIILGQSYIDMTNENIKSGDPMAVYKKMNEMDMFFGITLNNVLVAFRTFIFGILLAIGTVAMIVYNGIMVGVFQYFFYEKGLFVQSFLAIWLHGTLEISSIIIAGGAGITLGKGLIFPGTYSRLQAFQLSARRGLKLLIGILPILVFAAVIESFMTRYTDVPDAFRLLIILLSAFFIIFYFVIYPYKKARKGFEIPLHEGKLATSVNQEIKFTDVKTNQEIFKDIFILYKNKLRLTTLLVLFTSIVYSVSLLFIYPTFFNSYFSNSNYFFVLKIFNYADYPLFAVFNTIVCSIPLFLMCAYLHFQSDEKHIKQKLTLNFFVKNYYKSLLVSVVINAVLFLPNPLSSIVLIIILPFALLWQFAMFKENKSIFHNLSYTFQLANSSFGKLIGLYFILCFIGGIYFFFIDSPLVYFYFEILNWNVYFNDENTQKLFIFLLLFTSISALQMVIPLLCIGFNVVYFTLKEIKEANHLKLRVQNIGHK
jgi:uncharacterized membrane protein SpoIIM required for sporulation